MNRDINFFQSYEGIKKEKSLVKRYSLIMMIILCTVIGGSLIYNSTQIFILNKVINKLDKKLSSSEIAENLKKAEIIEGKISILNDYNSEINLLIEGVASRGRVSEEILNLLSSTVPSEVSFNDLTISNNEISINAKSDSRTAIAEIIHNLKKLSCINDVYIGSILENDSYSFNIKCTLKDVE